MTGPFHTHEPSAEFKAHLEWQLETAMRRGSRLAEPVTSAPLGGLRRFGTAAVILVALAVGGAAGIASERVQDVKTRDQLVESVKADQALLKTRYELARAELQEAQRRFEVGAVGREVVNEARRHVEAAETALRKLEIDIKEIQETKAAPRNELSAPKVGQTDFVSDRLRLELAGAERQLAATEEALAKAKRNFEVGLTTNAAMLQADVERVLALQQLQELRMRIEMRNKYLNEQLSVEQLTESVRRAQLTLEADATRQQLAAAAVRLKSMQAMVEIGTLSPLDVMRAEVELLELELKMKRIQEQLGASGKKKE